MYWRHFSGEDAVAQQSVENISDELVTSSSAIIQKGRNNVIIDIRSFLNGSFIINFLCESMYGRKPTISQVIYHLLQAFTTADYRFLIIFGNGQGLWKFQFEANFLRIFQGSRMVILSVFNSKPRLLFLRILRSKVWFLRIFPQFFIKVFVKVGWEILCFLCRKTEILALLYRVFL